MKNKEVLWEKGKVVLLMIVSFFLYGFAQSSLVIPKNTANIPVKTIFAIALCLAVMAGLEAIYRSKKQPSPWGLGQRGLSVKDMLVVFCGVFVMLGLQVINVSVAGTGTSQNQAELNKLTSLSTPLIYSMFIVVAPVCEEIIFRGLFFKLFDLKKEGIGWKILGVALSGLLFALAHDLNFDKFLPLYWMMGAILAGIYVYSKNLTDSILVHAITNAIPFILMALING